MPETTTAGRVGRPDSRFLWAHPAHFLALGFGSGLAPKAPGTFGTLVGFPLYFLLVEAPFFWLWAAAFLVLGVWVCEVTGRALGVHDHGGIVWDEVAAFFCVLPFAPQTLWGFTAAFALFRLFDIWKPFPIGWFDARVQGGFGVMLDDVLAAVYAVAGLWLLRPWL